MPTMLDKIWQAHLIKEDLIYIDLHLVHEVTSPQAFENLRLTKRAVHRPDKTLATADHNVPTDGAYSLPMIKDPLSRQQVRTLEENCQEFGIPLFSIGNKHQGIVHIIGPELGVTQPGLTIVCGDSHTATHGAFGALAFGIGTSEVEHVLATQTLNQRKPKAMRINYSGVLGHGVSAKDLILYTIGVIGTSGGAGYVIEYAGPTIESLSMEGRMTVCNMSIEAGAKAGMIAPDEKTYAWLQGKPGVQGDFSSLVEKWQSFISDDAAVFDQEISIDSGDISPTISWGTNPAQVIPVTGKIPEPKDENDHRSLEYMGLEPGQKITEIKLDTVFIGSCTNARISDLREAAEIVKGNHVKDNIRAMVVPGSQQVKQQAEEEGLDKIFRQAGFDWRSAGCSMCLGMNPDILAPQERCASTSNRNFEGRQGKGGRTHLVSPKMAAAAALHGHFIDIREIDK